MKQKSLSESGSVLWFILIAVVLIAALTAVLSRSSSTVDQSGDVEQLRVTAGRIMRTAKAYETAIQQMRLRGVSENDIDFAGATGAADNGACDLVSDCLVFDSGGGGLTYTAPPVNGEEWTFTESAQVLNVGTAAADLMAIINNMPADLCRQINRLVDVNPGGTPSFTPPVNAAITFTNFSGDYTATPTLLQGDATGQELSARSSGCFQNGSGGPLVFYSVILER